MPISQTNHQFTSVSGYGNADFYYADYSWENQHFSIDHTVFWDDAVTALIDTEVPEASAEGIYDFLR